MSLVSVSELARMVGVSRQAISWQIKAGKLPMTKGKVDTDNPAVAEYIAVKSAPTAVVDRPEPSSSVAEDDENYGTDITCSLYAEEVNKLRPSQ